jgi:hypothetical protein
LAYARSLAGEGLGADADASEYALVTLDVAIASVIADESPPSDDDEEDDHSESTSVSYTSSDKIGPRLNSDAGMDDDAPSGAAAAVGAMSRSFTGSGKSGAASPTGEGAAGAIASPITAGAAVGASGSISHASSSASPSAAVSSLTGRPARSLQLPPNASFAAANAAAAAAAAAATAAGIGAGSAAPGAHPRTMNAHAGRGLLRSGSPPPPL